MNTPTPRTCGELSCDECNNRTAALTTERDQLRAEVATKDDVINCLAMSEKALRAELARLDAEKPWLKEANATIAQLHAEKAESYAQFPVRMTREAYLADAKERDRLSATVSTLRNELARLVDHFECFEHTSSDPSDKPAIERARATIKEFNP